MFILSVVFLTTLSADSNRYDKNIKYFGWTGFVTHDGKLDFRIPMSSIRVKELIDKHADSDYFKVFYVGKKPKKVIKYSALENELKEKFFLDDTGIVSKIITFEKNSSLTCKYIYKAFNKHKRINTKKCDNGFEEVTYYNFSGIYKRIRFNNKKLVETMTFKNPYCYYFDANNSITGIEACILEPDNVPIKLF